MPRKSRLPHAFDCRDLRPARGGTLPVPIPFVLIFFLGTIQALAACQTEPQERGEREQRLQANVRLVGMAPSLNEWVLTLGGGEFLAARTDYDTHPDLLPLPSVGEGLDPNLERLVALEVTVALLVEGRDAAALQERLGSLGIRGVILPTNTITDVHETLSRLGGLLDRQERADSLSLALDRELSRIRERVGDRDPVDVMYVVGGNPPMTAAGGTFIHDLLEVAGGRNVFEDAAMQWPVVGFEAILERDPEVLIWPSDQEREATLKSLRETPGWREIPAVRDGRIVRVDGDLFNRPGPRLPEAARTLAKALHPGAFPNDEGWE